MGRINVYDKIMIESQKKEKMWTSKKSYTNLHQKIVYKWNSQLANAS